MIFYGQSSRLTRAEEAGYMAHPDDLLPPAANQPPVTLDEFAAELAATPFACSDCNRPTHEDDMAPSCGAHYLCVSCFETSDFRCRECRRVAVEQSFADDLAHELARDARNEWRDNRPEGLTA